MTFVESFLWGAGFSLGICVGLVAWAFLRTASSKILGLSQHWEQIEEINKASIAALEERNRLTEVTNDYMERIAAASEEAIDRG